VEAAVDKADESLSYRTLWAELKAGVGQVMHYKCWYNGRPRRPVRIPMSIIFRPKNAVKDAWNPTTGKQHKGYCVARF